MSQYNPYRIIREITEALEGFQDTVSQRQYNDVLGALRRSQEMIGKLSAAVLELDKDHRHGELMIESKLYANVLAGFFDEKNMSMEQWFDLGKGYNPYEHLTDKGVLKRPARKEPELVANPVEFSKTDWAMERAKHLRRLRVMKATEEIEKALAPAPAPAKKRGRPIGSRNRPKVDVGSRKPKAAVGPLYPNALKRTKASKGSSK
jgi:hypothetical protein